MRSFPMLLGLLTCLLLAGCESNAISRDQRTTFLDADDLVQMTDKMAASIASDPVIAQRTAARPMVIVMHRLDNRTNIILPHPRAEIFIHRVRVLMTSKQALRGQFTWVLDRQSYETLQRDEGLQPGELGPDVSRLTPEYALTARFHADTHADANRRSDYYLCTYQITALQSGEVVWEGTYETKKAITRELLD